ncbi:hypothetical protein [Sphingobium sp. EM0848]|uniref:hypothetical protein n=1 Tax=Sphingobium sp. EM0848 TaxID=2743473 RepID=UPI00159C62D7|nr:hypothetical protein [Sphingobium sp. EM0848]
MFSRGGYSASAKRRRRDQAEKVSAGFVAFAKDDPEKKLVLTYIARLVVDGHAEFEAQMNGEIEVRFTSGEIYLLAETAILRLV